MTKNSNHPAGLYLLFSTEMAERFSYFGMRAIFILYMTKILMMNDALANQIYGSYTGLVYLTPLIGGIISDRYWGNRRSIFVGQILMAAGQFMMFLSASLASEVNISIAFMFAALALIICGNGFFKPNISTMVGDLYHKEDKRRDGAFTIFYMGINIGAFFAPLVCGWLAEIDYKWGFLASSIAILISLIVFASLKNRLLVTPDGRQVGIPPVREKKVEVKTATDGKAKQSSVMQAIMCSVGFVILGALIAYATDDIIQGAILSACVMMPLYIIIDKSLTRVERRHIIVIYIIAFFVIFFWSAYEQAGASLTLFTDRNIDREFFGWTMPTAWAQSFNALFVVALAPVFAALWTWLDKRRMEPSSPAKQAIGLLLLSIGYGVIAIGVHGVDATTKISIFWLVSLYFIHTCGELSLSPIGLSMVTKLSPVRLSSLLMGVWYLSNAAANKLAGTLSSLMPQFDETTGEIVKTSSLLGWQITSLYDFFILFVGMSGIAGVILLVISPWLNRMMKTEE